MSRWRSSSSCGGTVKTAITVVIEPVGFGAVPISLHEVSTESAFFGDTGLVFEVASLYDDGVAGNGVPALFHRLPFENYMSEESRDLIPLGEDC